MSEGVMGVQRVLVAVVVAAAVSGCSHPDRTVDPEGAFAAPGMEAPLQPGPAPGGPDESATALPQLADELCSQLDEFELVLFDIIEEAAEVVASGFVPARLLQEAATETDSYLAGLPSAFDDAAADISEFVANYLPHVIVYIVEDDDGPSDDEIAEAHARFDAGLAALEVACGP